MRSLRRLKKQESREICRENAEYDAAKDEQRDIEARIEQIEKILKNAEVVLDEEIDLDKISIGCLVRVLDVEYDEEEEYKLVGSSEASSLQNKISNESPFGQALIGAKVGDIVEVEAPAGVIKYKVIEYSQSKLRGSIRMAGQKGQEQDLNQLLKVRRDKLADLQAAGKDPFQITKYNQTHHSAEVKELYNAHEAKILAGRAPLNTEGWMRHRQKKH